jgi:hypothetical protein
LGCRRVSQRQRADFVFNKSGAEKTRAADKVKVDSTLKLLLYQTNLIKKNLSFAGAKVGIFFYWVKNFAQLFCPDDLKEFRESDFLCL